MILVGDIHGEFKTLVYQLERHNIENQSVLIVGDCGFGFCKPEYYDNMYSSISKRLERRGITLYGIRGNHDDPSYFTGDWDKEYFKLLPDHVLVNIDGITVYPIGGAQSHDVNIPLDRFGNTRKMLEGKAWWKNERPIHKLDNLPEKCDLIVSHEAPISFGIPPFKSNIDEETYNNIIEDREYLQKVADNVSYDKWVFGHYHRSQCGTSYRGLDIMELYEYGE